ncbi:MAG TPA: hypothetical protein VKB48_01345, partial [Candidatus Acidoferrum sp.]|nr:hypothetical protein [Candidatus Acidoferrum sp.]
MNPHDQDPVAPKDAAGDAAASGARKTPRFSSGESRQPWLNEMLDQASAIESSSPRPEKAYPPDLQISWSWPHFLVFAVFVMCLLAAVPTA